jgi:hypothetical protein
MDATARKNNNAKIVTLPSFNIDLPFLGRLMKDTPYWMQGKQKGDQGPEFFGTNEVRKIKFRRAHCAVSVQKFNNEIWRASFPFSYGFACRAGGESLRRRNSAS